MQETQACGLISDSDESVFEVKNHICGISESNSSDSVQTQENPEISQHFFKISK